MITLDFETYPIIKGSPNPPIPVGIAVKVEDNQSYYFAWGHPSENNTTIEAVSDMLHGFLDIQTNKYLFHNAKFDAAILRHYFKIDIHPNNLHDTMIMAYLHDPREESFGLKYLAEKYVNMPPNEQQDLKAYILKHVPNATEKTWGAYICKAPANLVGKYAKADVDMTYALYNFFEATFHEEHDD